MMQVSGLNAVRCAFACLLLASPVLAAAQEAVPSQVATSSAGTAGTRQSRETGTARLAPNARIANRIQNRVTTRVRNRLDRYYDPQAAPATPFQNAEARARTAGDARPR
jgi:hypothetical protein